VHPSFFHPVVLFIWTAGWSTAVLFAWLTLNNALSARGWGAERRGTYVLFTGLSCAHALSIACSLLPTGLPAKVAIFQLMWALGTASLSYWIMAVRQFCGSRSRAILWMARSLLVVTAAAVTDLLLTPLLGQSLMFLPEARPPASLALRAAGMPATGSPYAHAMGAFGVALMLVACVALYRELLRSQNRDPFLYTGIAVSGLCTVAEIGLSAANSPYNMPLVFMANLIEAFRITWVTQRESSAELERITQAKNRQAAIIENQLAELKAISRLAKVGEHTARLTHDMRNPLTVALGSLDLIEHELVAPEPDPVEAQRMVALARQSIQHVSGLATKVTSQARPTGTEAVSEVSLVSVVEDALTLSPTSSVRVTNRIDPSVRVLGRPTELTQVFLNLLSNATNAQDSTQDPWIVIESEQQNGVVRIRVQDGGSRPSSEQLDRMFRTQFTTSTDGRGTGLGLTICKHIVDEHDGDIWVDRESPHTSIVVELPHPP